MDKTENSLGAAKTRTCSSSPPLSPTTQLQRHFMHRTVQGRRTKVPWTRLAIVKLLNSIRKPEMHTRQDETSKGRKTTTHHLDRQMSQLTPPSPPTPPPDPDQPVERGARTDNRNSVSSSPVTCRRSVTRLRKDVHATGIVQVGRRHGPRGVLP